MFRIDPVKEDGSFDFEFFGSFDYPAYRRATENYLRLEGFTEVEISRPFIFILNNRYWKIGV
jgi:hypothetical protein